LTARCPAQEDEAYWFGGPFTRDPATPSANGRPHYSTAAGGHLYYSVDLGSWLLNDAFTPAKPSCVAAFVTKAPVPVGKATWHYYDFTEPDTDGTAGRWGERALTLEELSAARLARQKKRYDPSRIKVSGCL
jgi:hypothetical protein